MKCIVVVNDRRLEDPQNLPPTIVSIPNETLAGDHAEEYAQLWAELWPRDVVMEVTDAETVAGTG